MARSLLKNLTNEELLKMSPGGSLDASDNAPWQARAFAKSPERPDWTDRGVQAGTRDALAALEPNILIGMAAMVELGFIDRGPDGKGMWQLLLLPVGWVPSDHLYAFPFEEEIAAERAERGI